MSFCPQCGRPVDASLHFCPSCGASRTPTAGAPGAQAPPARAPAPAYGTAPPPAAPGVPATQPWGEAPVAPGPGGPVGRTQEPWLVIVLSLVTFGIYGFIYWWRISREVDDYFQRPGHAHGKIKLGILLVVPALILIIVGYAIMLSSVFADLEGVDPNDPNAPAPDLGNLGLAMFFIFGGLAVALAGGILTLMGYWRVWKAIEEDERRRNVPSPLSPGLMLVFLIIPYVNIVTTWIAYHRTQKGLNGMWAAASAQAAPAQSASAYR